MASKNKRCYSRKHFFRLQGFATIYDSRSKRHSDWTPAIAVAPNVLCNYKDTRLGAKSQNNLTTGMDVMDEPDLTTGVGYKLHYTATAQKHPNYSPWPPPPPPPHTHTHTAHAPQHPPQHPLLPPPHPQTPPPTTTTTTTTTTTRDLAQPLQAMLWNTKYHKLAELRPGRIIIVCRLSWRYHIGLSSYSDAHDIPMTTCYPLYSWSTP